MECGFETMAPGILVYIDDFFANEKFWDQKYG